MFEPLIIGIVFPFIRARHVSFGPHQNVQAKLGYQLHPMWVGEEMDTGNLLHEFLLEYQRIRTMPPGVVRLVLYCTLSPDVLFHVKSWMEEEAERENKLLLWQRIRSVGGKKHLTQHDFLV
jgi:hypothetical protein